MDNTMKLLMAFIEASGFEVDKTIDTTQTPISKQSGLNRIANSSISIAGSGLVIDSSGAFKRGDDQCYYLKPSLNVDYKVTKKSNTSLEELRAQAKHQRNVTELALNKPLT